MNILILSNYMLKTGVGNHIVDLIKGLKQENHSVVLACSKIENTQIDVSNNNFDFYYLKEKILCISNLRILHYVITKHNIDVVHCHHRQVALLMKIYNLVFSKVPVVYTLHLCPIPHDFFHRLLTFSGDISIGVSTEVSFFLHSDLNIPTNKIVTIPNGVDTSLLTPLSENEVIKLKKDYNISFDKLVLCMHSRIADVKNQILMVDAISKLKEDERRKIVVMCSGECKGSYYNNLVTKIREKGLSEIFIFTGWIETRKILGISDMLFVPSKKEGFLLSAAEAFLMKVPVARSHTAGFEDMKDICLQISNQDSSDIVKIVRTLLYDGKMAYKDMIENAYLKSNNEFTVEIMTKRTIDVYKSLLN